MLDSSTLDRDGRDSFRLSKTSTDDIFPNYKILIIGDPGIGKTSLIRRYILNEFQEDNENTIGLDYHSKRVQVTPKDRIVLKIWDTAGSEKFHSIAKNYFTNCDGIVLCFDSSDKKTYNNLYDWIKYINNYVKILDKDDDNLEEKETQDEKEKEEEEEFEEEEKVKEEIKWFEEENMRPIIALTGTKSDIEEKEVNNKDIDKLKKYLDCEYFETSSKDGKGIEDLFFYMAKELFEKIDVNKNKKGNSFRLTNKRIDEEDEGFSTSKLVCC